MPVENAAPGALLRGFRLRAWLSQESLAVRSGVSVRTIRNLETGRAGRPRHESVRLLATALKLDEAERAELEGAFDRTTPNAVLPAQLPPDTVPFSGRDSELHRLDVALKVPGGGGSHSPPVVNVSGPVGVGKSALAVHWGHRAAAAFPDGQIYVNLAGGPAPPERILRTLIRTLTRSRGGGPSPLPDDPADAADPAYAADVEECAALYRSLIAHRRMLIVLDNARHERQVRPLLPGTPACSVLVTSRARLTALENADVLDLAAPGPPQALDLLAHVAGTARVAAEAQAARRIVELCGRLPLALRIAGARLAARPHWPLATLAGRLAAENHRLDELSAGDLDVRRRLATGYRELDGHQRTLLRRLGFVSSLDSADTSGRDTGPGPGRVFPGTVAMPLLDVSRDTAESLMEALAETRFLSPRGPDGTGRFHYRLDDLTRLFARERALAEESPDVLATLSAARFPRRT